MVWHYEFPLCWHIQKVSFCSVWVWRWKNPWQGFTRQNKKDKHRLKLRKLEVASIGYHYQTRYLLTSYSSKANVNTRVYFKCTIAHLDAGDGGSLRVLSQLSQSHVQCSWNDTIKDLVKPFKLFSVSSIFCYSLRSVRIMLLSLSSLPLHLARTTCSRNTTEYNSCFPPVTAAYTASGQAFFV